MFVVLWGAAVALVTGRAVQLVYRRARAVGGATRRDATPKTSWWSRNICTADPEPRYTRLDRRDGLRDSPRGQAPPGW
jgi:hypothetical protein